MIKSTNKGTRIFAKGVYASNNDIRSGLNNNDLVIGGTGSGKTGGYVIPNISREKGSIVVVDTKGRLYDRFRDELTDRGYKVRLVDFVSPERSDSYDPLCFVRKHGGKFREKDIEKISRAISAERDPNTRIHGDKYWNESANIVISFLIAYSLETKGSAARMSDVFNNFRKLQADTAPICTTTAAVEHFMKKMDRKKTIRIPFALTDAFEKIFGLVFDPGCFDGKSGDEDFDRIVKSKTLRELSKFDDPGDFEELPDKDDLTFEEHGGPEGYTVISPEEQNKSAVESVNSGDCVAGLSEEDFTRLQVLKEGEAKENYGDFMTIALDNENNQSGSILKWVVSHPQSSAAKYWDMFQDVRCAQPTWACILTFVTSYLRQFAVEENMAMMSENRQQVDLKSIGLEKTALFVNVSDSDRSTDTLARVFFTQLLQAMMDTADKEPEGRLPIPVRIYLDDFASGVVIDNFDKIISVTRSRNIAVSVIIQNLTQLITCYGRSAANTIVTNCDHIIYLGGQDMATADYISIRADIPMSDVLSMKNDEACVIERGSIGKFYKKIVPYKGHETNKSSSTKTEIGEQVIMEMI